MVGHDGLLSFTGTVLSGLGTTLNGISTLYTLSHAHLTTDVAALVSSTAVGAWVAAKAGMAMLIDHGMATMGFGGGCISISIGLVHFLRSLAKIDGNTPPRHAPDMLEDDEEVKNFPTPQWLNRRVLNWAVVGRVGAGKSSLINALRGLSAQDSEAAAVGVGHTTKRPKPYSFTGDLASLAKNMARLWDLPGAGTKDWPSESYVRDAGLRHFDGVLLVVAGAFSDAEEVLLKQLEDFKVPCYVVRNKVDQDTENNKQDNCLCPLETLAEIRSELMQYGCNRDRIFLVSAKHPQLSDFDFQNLLYTMADDVSMQRNDLPEFAEDGSCSNQDQIFQDAQSEPFGLGDMPIPHFGGA
mmetsp:Transcript_44730/g.97183  ORF Transcript_44730/g.97183 Transcript_44730/m.97183 type:complete len:354 (-) Transcript_44730:139-1200(-)